MNCKNASLMVLIINVSNQEDLAMLDVFKIRELPRIFSSNHGCFGYDYYKDPKSKWGVYLEYNIDCEAQYLYGYQLKEDKGIFILIIMSDHVCDPEIEVAGHSEIEAVEYLIKRILEKPANHESARVNIKELERSLRAALLPATV